MAMSAKNLIFIHLMVGLLACQGPTRSNLTGEWRDYGDQHSFLPIRALKISKKQIFLTDQLNETLSGSYQISNHQLYISLDNGMDTFFQITDWAKDSFVELNHVRFDRNFLSFDNVIIQPPLIGITTDQVQNDFGPFARFDLFKNTNRNTQLILGNKRSTPEETPIFLGYNHKKSPRILIFIREGITLQELYEIYYRLANENIRRAILILKLDGIGRYHFFKDRILIWPSDREDFAKSHVSPPPPPPTPIDLLTISEFLGQKGRKLTFSTKKDFWQLDALTRDSSYLIQIAPSMAIEDYILLKQQFFFKLKNGYQLRTRYLYPNIQFPEPAF